MIAQTVVAKGVLTLKWLVVPAAAAPTIATCSTIRATAITVPTVWAKRRQRGRCAISQAHVTL